MTHFFNLTPGTDNFTGVTNDYNAFQLTSADLQSTDTVTGAATGSFFDVLIVYAAGTITGSQFSGVTNIEQINLSSGGNNVSLTNGLVAGTSTGFFTVLDGGGNDTVNASAVSTKPIVFYAAAGADTFTGGGGNDSFVYATADLTSADTIQGGAGIDNLYFSTAGTVAASAFTNVTGIEGIGLNSGGNNVTLTNALVAGSNSGSFAVSDGAGNDTVDASGVTNGATLAFFASAGSDTFRGGNGANGYVFTASDLTSADTVQGGAGTDNLFISTAGTLGASAFTNVTNIEALVLANGTNNVTLTNGLVAGTSIGYFAVAGSTGNDTVDGSGVTNGTALAFYGTTGGNDTFTGGNGNDSFLFAAGGLTAADTVVGGGGNDTLWMTTAGTTTTAALVNVTGIEGVFLQAGGTFNLANGITGAASLATVGSSAVDTFDASLVTGYKVAFTGNGGADHLIGGSQDDTFFIADSAFASINGNAGIDRITLTAASQSFDLTANAPKITNLEVIDLLSSLNSTLTLAGTDIALVNASGTSLYVVGDVDDTVNAGNGYTQIASGVVNNAVAPGRTFFEYQHSSGSLLFIDSAITSLTATTGNGSASVPEGTAGGATVFNAQQAGATTYVLGGADAALFSIDGTGHISFNASPDFETPLDQGTNNVYDLTVTSSNGTATPNFVETVTITVTDVSPSTPVDSDSATADSVVEGAAVGTYTGVTASSTDVNGPAVTWLLTGDTSGGGFTIGADGKIKIANASLVNYETATHSYDVTAQASDGAGGTSSHTFTITVTNTNPSAPTDSDSGTANTVVEGAAIGTYTGLTASSADVNGPTVTWSLTADSSGGAFGIGADGKVTVIDPSLLDFESTNPGHTYHVTAQASDTAGGTASQSFDITVTNANPSTPADSDTATADTVDEGAVAGTYTGVTAAATDPNGPAVTWTLTGDTSGGGFTIGADGKINVANSSLINYEPGTHSYDVTAQASDGAGGTSTHIFTISVGDVAPSTPVDSDTATADSVPQSAIAGTYTGVTASSTDVNGPAVTWSLTGDTSGGGFGIDSTGKITVIDSSKIIGPSYTVTAQASDGTLSSHQDFVITVVPNTAPTATADSLSATEKGGVNNATGGTDPTGNVITGTGGATADTDAETPAGLTVISFGTGSSGGTPGVVDGTTQLTGDHGSLTLDSSGNFHYFVNQNDAAVQALVPASAALTDTFHYTIQDPGGLTSTAVITVSINGANDLPLAVNDTGVTFTMGEDAGPTSFLVRANDSLDPDTGAANTVAPGAVTVTGTPAGTTIGNADATAAAFNANQEIQVTLGAAFQQLHAGETATVNVPYTLLGNAGETSNATLTVTVNGANDVPIAVDDSGSMTEDQSGTAFTVLTGPGADTLDPDHGAPIATTPGAVTIGAITNLSAPAGESIDAADFSVSVNGTNQIVVTLVGTDVQHMKQGESTTFDVPYTLHGDLAGDLANAVLHVTVNGVNDAPTGAGTFTFNAANSAIGNTSLVLDDGVGPAAPDPAGPQKTISGSLLTGANDVDGPNALATVAVTNQATTHGHVTISTSGEFSYTPTAGYIGSDSFNYTITDGNTPTAGTVSGSVTINVATPKVWYVNADAATDGDGTSANPFNTLTHFQNSGVGNNVDGAGDTIFLYNATNHYSGLSTLTLENNEKLIGENQGLTVNGTTLVTAAATNGAIIDGGVVLGSGDTISGVTLGNTGAGTALSGTGFGTLNIDHTVVNTDNNGMVLTNGAFGAGAAFTSFTSGGATDVSLTNVTGSVDLGTGTMSGQFAVTGGSVNTTYSGNLSQANNAAMVNVSGGHTGTMTFQTGTLTATNGTGLQFDNADGAYNFNGTNTLSNAVGGGNANAGINIVNGSGGNFSFSSNSSIVNQTTGTAFNVAGGNGTITYAGTIGTTDSTTDNSGNTSVSITGRSGGSVSLSGSIFDSNDTGGGIGVSNNTGGTVTFSGTAKTLNTGIGDAVSMTNNASTTVNFSNGGLDIDTTNGTGFSATVAGTYSVTGSGNTITTVTGNHTGTALNLANVTVGAGGVLFDSATTTANATPANSSDNGILLNTLSGGAITVTGGSIAGANIRGVDINATSNDISIGAGVSTSSTGRSVEVTSTTGNKTIAFSGAIDDNGLGVNLATNTGTTMNFTGGLQIDTASGSTGFSATAGGTVNVTGSSNHIASTGAGGTALNIANTTIGGSNVTFHDISSNGATNGIVLNTTGSSGGLIVTGNGTNNFSGGIIQNSTNNGVLLTSTQNVSLTSMKIDGSGHSGIQGTGVTNFSFVNGTINNSGTGLGAQDSNIAFNGSGAPVSGTTYIGGTLTVTGSTLSNAYYHGVTVRQDTGTISNLNISNNSFTSSTVAANSNGSAIDIDPTGSATTHATITKGTIDSNTIANFPSGAGIQILGGNTTAGASGQAVVIGTPGNATNILSITNNHIAGQSVANGLGTNAIAFQTNGYAQANIDISNNGTLANPLQNFKGNAILVGATGFSNVHAKVDNNWIDGSAQIASSPGISIGTDATFSSADTPHLTIEINDNHVSNTDGNGILATARSATGVLDIHIDDNVVGAPRNGVRQGIRVDSGNVNSVDDAVHLEISGNTSAPSPGGGGSALGIGLRKQGTVSTTNDFSIQGLPGGSTSTPNVEAYVNSQNPSGGGTLLISATSGFSTFGSVPSPLLAALGGVQASSTPSATHDLTQAELDSAVVAAIGLWKAAGASDAQIAAMQATHLIVDHLDGNVIGDQQFGQIAIDTDAAGHGWFIDPTPTDNSEFTHAQNAAGTDLLTDPSNAAAGHLDLLTTVAHELGHVIGLDDTTEASTANDLMYINLVDGERRVPDATDVAHASEADIPQISQAPAGTPVVAGNAANNTIDAGHGGNLLFGGAGADTFVFGPSIQLNAPTPAQITHVADYSAAQGDTFDFSALTSAFHNSSASDTLVVRAVEDASGKFATLQVDNINPNGLPSAPNWVNVAQLDGAHAGDAVNILIDNHSVHLAQIHVDLLV